MTSFKAVGKYGHGVEVGSGAAAEAEHEVKGRLLLDVVIRKSAAVLELLSGEDQALLVWRDALLVLDPGVRVSKRRAECRAGNVLGLDVVDRVRRLDLERDRLASEGCEAKERQRPSSSPRERVSNS